MKTVSSAIYAQLAIAVLIALFLSVTLPRISFAQTEPLVGSWRLNVAKSTFNPGPGPRAQTWTIESAGGGLRLNLEGMGAQGGQQKSEWPIVFDGRPHPVTGNVNTDAITSRRIDPYTLQGEYLKGGSTVGNWTIVVSRDGRVTTITASQRLANGQQNNNVSVFERQ
jgi:hypothetical protein